MDLIGKCYEDILSEIKGKIPPDEYRKIMLQDGIDIDDTFLGFVNDYASIRDKTNIPKDYTIIDLGCAFAAQAYLFTEYEKYIGVDICGEKRFSPTNCQHYRMSIQEFIRDVTPRLDVRRCVAICCAVPDIEAMDMVYQTFPSVFVFYPGMEPKMRMTYLQQN